MCGISILLRLENNFSPLSFYSRPLRLSLRIRTCFSRTLRQEGIRIPLLCPIVVYSLCNACEIARCFSMEKPQSQKRQNQGQKCWESSLFWYVRFQSLILVVLFHALKFEWSLNSSTHEVISSRQTFKGDYIEKAKTPIQYSLFPLLNLYVSHSSRYQLLLCYWMSSTACITFAHAFCKQDLSFLESYIISLVAITLSIAVVRG